MIAGQQWPVHGPRVAHPRATLATFDRATARDHANPDRARRVHSVEGVTSRPHDALFRSAFEHPDDAAGEVRHVLPPGVVEAIDWSTLRLEPGSFIDPELADRHSDLLFSAWIADAPALIYLLLEHQSTPDPRMPLSHASCTWCAFGNDAIARARPARYR